MNPVTGINIRQTTQWLNHRLPLVGELTFQRLHGGRSNLTFLVSDELGQRYVLRRPPLHGTVATAHDVGREYRIIQALHGTDIPVPNVFGYESDSHVAGAPFFIMEFIDGDVMHDRAAALRLASTNRWSAAISLVGILATLHELDPAQVGMKASKVREPYVSRQLRRWASQLPQSRPRERELLEKGHRELSKAVPEQTDVSIVHGDYRLDNVILAPTSGSIIAVLDWELSTVGDPCADVGLMLAYWTESQDEVSPLLSPPTVAPGFPGRDDLIEEYTRLREHECGNLPFYTAFGFWKLACIAEGVFQRYSAGSYGQEDESYLAFGPMVRELAERSLYELG